jgi:hypothetical protein
VAIIQFRPFENPGGLTNRPQIHQFFHKLHKKPKKIENSREINSFSASLTGFPDERPTGRLLTLAEPLLTGLLPMMMMSWHQSSLVS